MYAILNYAIMVYAFLAVRETKGRSLEDMETVFGTGGALERGPRQDDSVRLISDYDWKRDF